MEQVKNRAWRPSCGPDQAAAALPPLATSDATAYDYANSFNFTQPVTPAPSMVQSPVPRWELEYLQAHPADSDDPT